MKVNPLKSQDLQSVSDIFDFISINLLHNLLISLLIYHIREIAVLLYYIILQFFLNHYFLKKRKKVFSTGYKKKSKYYLNLFNQNNILKFFKNHTKFNFFLAIHFFFKLTYTIISFYILIDNIYYKKSSLINAWRFPMLLAILIEEYMH